MNRHPMETQRRSTGPMLPFWCKAVIAILAICTSLSVPSFGLPAQQAEARVPLPLHPAVRHAQMPMQQTPRPRISTSGAAGVAASFRAPQPPELVHTARAQSSDDWTPDFSDSFDSGLSLEWLVTDDSDDGFDRTWGANNVEVNSGANAVWVAAGGADAVDPQTTPYPPNLDSWLITNRTTDLSSAQNADVEFNMYMDTEVEFDWIFVGVSTDGTNYTGEFWSGLSGGWQSFDLDLSAYIGYPNVSLAWYFHNNGSNQDGDHRGVWLDDVTLWTYVDSGPVQGTELLQNGDFETGGLSGWTSDPDQDVQVIEEQNPLTGTHVAQFSGNSAAYVELYQPLSLPAGDVSGAHFGLWVNLFGEETEIDADLFCAGIYDSSRVNLLFDLGCRDGAEATSATFDASAWQELSLDLTGEDWGSIAGQNVNLVLEMSGDAARPTNVMVDDITFEIVTGGDGGDRLEPNDSAEAATTITAGTPISDVTIAPAQDYDFFAITATAGVTVVVDVDAAVNGSALDAYAVLLDSSGKTVCENDDDGYSVDPYLACKVTTAGPYYARIGSYDGSGDRNYVYAVTISLISSGTPTPEEPAPVPDQPTPTNKRAWTAILYLDGDNNLCDSYPGLIARMEKELSAKIGTGGFLHVAVLFDPSPADCQGQSATTRYLIQPNGVYSDTVNRWNMGELNMGDPQTLINFATWAMENYPADHYYLAIDNHGGGISGIAWDDSNGGDNLTNPELFAALKEITKNGERKLDVFAFEACLMNMYENVYDLRQFAEYIFGFPTISFANNASYPSYLGDARFTATTNARTLGDILFDIYYAAVTNPYAVALVDTSKLDALHAEVNAWAGAVQAQLGTAVNAITMGRTNAQKVDANGNNSITDDDAFIDLWDLADKLALQGIAAPQADTLKSAIEAAVVRLAYRPAGPGLPLDYSHAHGLTIFWPKTASGSYTPYVENQLYNSTRDGQWDEFLQAYFGPSANSGRRGMQTTEGPIERLLATPANAPLYLPSIQR